MGLRLPDKWVWDCWFADDGQRFHVFYLHASRALGDPDRRHWYPMVGHAISDDLTNWTVVRDALAVSDRPAYDDGTTWTGSVMRDDDGVWWMFYTGTCLAEDRWRQRILAARSSDLMVWEKVPGLVVEADTTWYSVARPPDFPFGDFRDPWVFRLPGDPDWHMLMTAAVDIGNPRGRGVIGHATSPNLVDWTMRPPLSRPGSGFGNLEVPQYAVVDGVPLIVFCCAINELAAERAAVEAGGSYSVPVPADLSRIDIASAHMFPELGLYAGRVVQGRDGRWNLIGFRDIVDGHFVGEISDPIPVTADPVLGLVRRSGSEGLVDPVPGQVG